MPDGKQPLDCKAKEPAQLKFEISELVPQVPENGDENSEHNNPDEKAARDLAKLELLEKSIVYYVRMAILVCLPVLCLVVLSSFALHLVLPSCWQWLTNDQVEAIKGVSLSAFGGLFLAIGTTIIMKK